MAVDLSMSVLVVDDYNTMIRIIKNLLRQIGFEDIDDASDGALALAKMRMEPMTGFELLKQVRSDPAIDSLPFIMITAESRTENVVAAKQAGVSNYIVKPFNAETLRSKIDAVFRVSYHASLRVTAFGATPAALNISCNAAVSGASRPTSSAWMPAITNSA